MSRSITVTESVTTLTPDRDLELVHFKAERSEVGRYSITRESLSTNAAPRHLILGYDHDELRAMKTAIENLLAQID